MNHPKEFSARRNTLAFLGLTLLAPWSMPVMAAAADSERIIIQGASGQLGRLTVEELLHRGVDAKRLILVSRTPDELVEYQRRGASVRFGDLTKPESLPAAYAGGQRMLLISIIPGPGISRPVAHKAGFDAAVKAGVKHIVYTSFIAAQNTSTSPMGADHLMTEGSLKASGAKWTILRNGDYDDVFVTAAVNIAKKGQATMPPDEMGFAPVTRADCAAAAAGALLNPRLSENRSFIITGSELYGTRDIAAYVSAVIGKPVEVKVQAGAGDLPPDGNGGPVTNDVATLSGHPASGLKASLDANRARILAAAQGAGTGASTH